MFNKIEFSDLYKFLTSVGLLFIASAFIIPWLYMKQDMGVSITNEEYEQLVNGSKYLVDRKICFSIFLIKILPFVCIFLFLSGIFLSYFGISNWLKKQKYADETEEINLAELRSRARNLKPSEIDEKAISEVEAEIKAKTDSNGAKEIETVNN